MKNTEKPNGAAPVSEQVANDMLQTGEAGSNLGIIRIHDNVLAALVSRAVLGVAGVSRMAGSAIIDNLAGIVGSHSRAIEIIKESADKIKIVVKVNVCFGTVIPVVAVAVQRQVIEQVEKAAGISVAAVDVIVQQLDDPEEEENNSEQDSVNGVKLDALRSPIPGSSMMA